MLLLSLPNGQTEGDCKINGEACEFQIEDNRLGFRPKGSDGRYDVRTILHAGAWQGGQTLYTCTSADGEGSIIVPDAAD